MSYIVGDDTQHKAIITLPLDTHRMMALNIAQGDNMKYDKSLFYGSTEQFFNANLFHLRNPHINPTLCNTQRISIESYARQSILNQTNHNLTVYSVGETAGYTMAYSKHNMMNIPLTTEELKLADKWIVEFGDDPLELLDQLLDAGYKVSARYIDDRKAFCFTVTGTDSSNYNSGCSMSTWSSELSDAVGLATWKVGVLFKFQAWVDRSSDTRRG